MLPKKKFYRRRNAHRGGRRRPHRLRKPRQANVCSHCGEEIRELPYRCRYCGEIFCPNHHIPEVHECKGLSKPSWSTYRGKRIKREPGPVRTPPIWVPSPIEYPEVEKPQEPPTRYRPPKRRESLRSFKTRRWHIKKNANIKKIVGLIAIVVFVFFVGYFILLKGENYYLSIGSRQQGAELIISGETNLPDNSELEISVPSLGVSGSATVENGRYEWRVQCPVNAPSGDIQIIISSPLKKFENSTTTFWARVNSPPIPDFTYTREARAVGFVDNSSDDGTIVSWKWEFDTGGISNDRNPTFTYSNRGIYEVRLTVTDNGGAQATCTKAIAVPDTLSYTWTYGGRLWRREIEIVNETEKYERMSHAVYVYGIQPIGAYLSSDAKKFVTAEDQIIRTFAENLEASYVNQYGPSEDGLADFVLRFVQEAIPYYEHGIKDNLYYWPYALEVLAAKKGNCTDKSILYASFIEALGYHASLVDLEKDSHMMVGIRLSERPSMASTAGYINKVVVPFDKNGVKYWPAETTSPGWNLGERDSGLHADIVNMYILPITEPPVASASATPTMGKAPLEVSFTGFGTDSDGNVISYRWDFKDGSTSNEQNPVHIFQNEGNYDVWFTVIDDDGETDSEWIEITVEA